MPYGQRRAPGGGPRPARRCRPAPPGPPPPARGRQRPADHPGPQCSRRSRACPSTSPLHESTSGIAALLTGGKPGPTILLRGDMDALPMPEDTGLDFAQRGRRRDARLRARHPRRRCWPAPARLLAARRADLPGRVLFMFQPGEEGHHGARYMLDEGLLDVPPLADGTRQPGHGGVRHAHHVAAPERAGSARGRGRSWRRRTRCASGSRARAATPASRTARSTRSRSPARSCRRCRRWSPARIDVFDPAVVTVASITAGTTEQRHPRDGEI